MAQSHINLIELLYSSVCEEHHWEPALQALSTFVGGTAVVHMASNPARRIVTAAESIGAPEGQAAQFQAHYADKEIRLAPAMRYGVGIPLIDWQLLPMERIRSSVIYHEFLLPNDIPYLLAVWVRKGATESASLSFHGTKKRGPFTQLDADRLRSVIPHLLRVYEARQLLAKARATRFAYRHILDGLPFGVILLDALTRVIDATSPAERVLRENQTLGVFEGRIRARDPADQKILAGAIEAVCKTEETRAGATIRLRHNTRERLTLMVIPVPTDRLALMASSARCMVLVVDPRTKLQAHAAVLQKAFELTPAEAVLAAVLFRSPTLREASLTLGRTYNTCKTQLKSIYAKVQVSSQLELAQKIMLVTLASSPG
jgi:DNA-binding CsgD family transcriptional regulator